MPEAITIDNLPIETSVQWAEAQESIDRKYVDETPQISTRTEILVNQPKLPSLDQLFETKKKAPTWAFFIEPEHFRSQSNRFFKQSIIPNTVSEEYLDRLEEIAQDIKAKAKAEDFKNCEVLKSFFKVSSELDKMLTEIRSRVLQFRKG